MNIIIDLKKLIKKYKENNSEEESAVEKENENCGEEFSKREERLYGKFPDGIQEVVISWDGTRLVVHEKINVVPLFEISNLIEKYRFTLTLTARYYFPELIDDSYFSSKAFADDLEQGSFNFIFRSLEREFDSALMSFEKMFGFYDLNWKGKGLYIEIALLERLLAGLDDEIERNKNCMLEGIDNSQKSLSFLRDIAVSSYSSIKELEDHIMDAVFLMYGKGFRKWKEVASKRSGYGIGGTICINKNTWQKIQSLWMKISTSNPNIFDSSRYDNTHYENHNKPYNNDNFKKYLDKFFASVDGQIERNWLEFHSRFHAAFYGKHINT